MTFKIINGGDKVGHSSEQLENQFKVFVAQMQQIEYMISTTKRVSQKMKWDELDERLTNCHREILSTLGFVKRTSKNFKLKQHTKPTISLVVNNKEISNG
jgi:hypothetical protein